MKLITEQLTSVQYLVEKKEDGTKNVFIEGIFMQAEKPNKNGRMYPKGIMEKEIARYQDLEEGVRLGVSSRGLGSLKERNGINEVQDDFHLATVDIVADPSAPDAFVQGIMESAEWILDNGVWKPIQIEQAQQAIRKASKADLSTVKLQVFESFLRSIK